MIGTIAKESLTIDYSINDKKSQDIGGVVKRICSKQYLIRRPKDFDSDDAKIVERLVKQARKGNIEIENR